MEKNISNLKQAYNELKDSKMVLAPKHISKILKAIAEDDYAYNLIAEQVLGFDFGGVYEAVIKGEKEMAEIVNSDNVVPFAFCLLNEIDNQTIELVQFIKRVYKSDTEEVFKMFCEEVVGAFVEAVSSPEHSDEQVEEDPSESIEEIFANGLDERVRYIVTVITEKITVTKKVKPSIKKDLDIVCFSIDLCLNLMQFAGIFGLLSGLKYILQPLKKFKMEIAEIDLILDSINNM